MVCATPKLAFPLTDSHRASLAAPFCLFRSFERSFFTIKAAARHGDGRAWPSRGAFASASSSASRVRPRRHNFYLARAFQHALSHRHRLEHTSSQRAARADEQARGCARSRAACASSAAVLSPTRGVMLVAFEHLFEGRCATRPSTCTCRRLGLRLRLRGESENPVSQCLFSDC